ncbi:MAG: SDR family oxidoreductase [Bryobacter sp.]|nr:SDR family oxidoreductase [Bryobacter sp.]
MRIDGARVLLTGASTGIGAALAQELAGLGARQVLVSRKTGLYTVPRASWCAADLTQSADRERAVATAMREMGGVDILVNNAGVGAYVPSAKISEADWHFMRELNLDAPVHLARLCLPAMLEARRGLVVNVASIAGHVPLPWFSLYSATKAALLQWTHGLRMELDGTGVTTVAVSPGYVKTPFQSNVLAGRPPLMLQRTKKFGITPEQCARAIRKGIERESRTVVTPPSGHFLNWAYHFAPRVIDKMFAKYNRELAQAEERIGD